MKYLRGEMKECESGAHSDSTHCVIMSSTTLSPFTGFINEN